MSDEVYMVRRHVWIDPPKNRGDLLPRCEHCGLIFESDLGWTSADGVVCIERPAATEQDIPKETRQYARFRGFNFKPSTGKYIRAYHDEEYTIFEMVQMTPPIITHDE